MNIKKLHMTFILLIPLLFLTLACDITDKGTLSEKSVAVKMQIKSATPLAKQKTSGTSIMAVDTLTQVKLLVDEFELDSIDEDSLDFEVEELVVNLPLDGSELVLSTATVPEGVYDEFELEVDDPDDDSSIQDPDLIEGEEDSLRYSVVVKGIYNGQEFTYKSQVEFELELELNPPLTISSASPSVGVKVLLDPYSWFIDSSTGQELDPTNPDNQERIDENIENSFEAEEDNEDDDENDDSDDSDS